ncbi:MAG TPA: MFS transporter [Polyangium sp.]|nr:MFS transporter [Polyangium sp.]
MTTTSHDDYPLVSRRHAWALTLVATLTMAVSYIDRQALAALAPTICDEFKISETAYGTLVSAFSLAYLVASPFAGALVDRVGARRGLLGAVLVWSFVAALHALVPGFGVLFFLRIALGTAEAPSFPGAAQTVQRALAPAERARGFGVLFTGSSIGAMIAPPLATFLLKRWNWQAAFLGTAIVGLIWVPMWIAVSWRGKAPVLLDAVHVSDKPKPSAWSVVTHPAVLRAALAIGAVAPAMGFVLNWGAKFLDKVHHIPRTDVGPYLILPPLLYDLGSVVFGHLASVRRAKRVDGSSDRPLFVAAAVLMLVLVATPFGRSPWESMALAAVGMAGGGGVFAMVTADYLGRVHPAIVSLAGGMAPVAQSIAYIVFSPILGKLISTTDGYVVPFLVLGVWLFPGFIGWLLWKPPPPYQTELPAS